MEVASQHCFLMLGGGPLILCGGLRAAVHERYCGSQLLVLLCLQF